MYEGAVAARYYFRADKRKLAHKGHAESSPWDDRGVSTKRKIWFV